MYKRQVGNCGPRWWGPSALRRSSAGRSRAFGWSAAPRRRLSLIHIYAESQAGPIAGVIVQLGGQTPLRLSQQLEDAGVKIVGTSPEAIFLAEDREAFEKVLDDAGLPRCV